MDGIKMYLDNDTLSSTPTHFLRGVELIKQKAEEIGVQSEDWVYPIWSFGHPKDDYYNEF